jgi:hypothetical protein
METAFVVPDHLRAQALFDKKIELDKQRIKNLQFAICTSLEEQSYLFPFTFTTSDLNGLCYVESEVIQPWKEAGYRVSFGWNPTSVKITLDFQAGMTYSKRKRATFEEPNKKVNTNPSDTPKTAALREEDVTQTDETIPERETKRKPLPIPECLERWESGLT